MWAHPVTQRPEGEQEQLKKAFALAWLYEPDSAYAAALKVFGPDTGCALWVADHWQTDPIVTEEKKRLLKEHGSLYFLPDKTQIAREVYNIAKDDKKSGSERLQFYKLYSDLLGFIEPKVMNNNGVINNNQGAKVMVVKDHGTNEQWEDRAKGQQKALQEKALQDIEQPAQ